MSDQLSSINADEDSRNAASAPWMKRVLLAAAVYNIVWGLLAILFPMAFFRLTNVRPLPLYPELWQCVGMIVGVYGVGYGIAARHPCIHWPVVLVGLLGKVFGPIGLLLAVSSGRLPASFAWVVLTNDLIWWIPFAMILWEAARYHQSRVERLTVSVPTRKIDPLGRMMSQRGATLQELSRRSPVLVVFLRHSGCIFCREAVADVARQREQIEQQGTQIAFVHMGQAEPVELLKKHHLDDVHSFRDPVCSLYDAFGLTTGSFRQLLGPGVWIRGTLARLRGHKPGAFNGNVFRMPGVFLLSNSEIVRSYRHSSAADRPDYAALASLPQSEASHDHVQPPDQLTV